MPRSHEQPKNRGDSRSIGTNQRGKLKPLDVRASSQRLEDEQRAISQASEGKSTDSHPSTSGKGTPLSLRDQSSDTEQDLGASMKRVGAASTRDLARRAVDVNNRSNQVKNKNKEYEPSIFFKRLKIKRLIKILVLPKNTYLIK